MDISFVIPAYNEQDNIADAIESITHFVPREYDYDILVVDHGSGDRTVARARESGAVVLEHPDGTIAGLRNHGAANSLGQILVFLDADIRLTGEWHDEIGRVIRLIRDDTRIITGSWYSIPDQPNWIEKYWFKPLERGDSSHINSGHLVIARAVFDEIKGFDENLETGEDYDISIRAKNAGIRLIDNVRLKVIHEGYPKSIGEFIMREYWHGKGDAQSLRLLLKSKIAMISLLFLLFHFMLLAGAYYGDVRILSVSALLIMLVPLSMSIYKYSKENIRTILINAGVYYIYFWSRAFSVLSLPGLRSTGKRSR